VNHHATKHHIKEGACNELEGLQLEDVLVLGCQLRLRVLDAIPPEGMREG
jgi:hypothetical protein